VEIAPGKMLSDNHNGAGTNALNGGVAGEYPSLKARAVLVAPASAAEHNTLRTAFFPIACWRVDDIRFEFDSSFVKPDMADEMAFLAKLIEERKNGDIKPPLSIFGHADPVGNDDYNKQLSGRRAQAIYGLLIRDAALWEELYSHPLDADNDNWGMKSIQIMLATLLHPDAENPDIRVPYYQGPIDSIQGEKTTAAVKNFQSDNELKSDGVAGPKTRKKLFLAYMDVICRDENGNPFKLEKADFLARGADSEGKGDYQGCGEFNPVLMFSQAENEKFKKPDMKAQRDAENAPNRRVVVLLFRPGSRVDPEKWPCPRAKEGVAGCKKRFWSDADIRRSFQDQRREYATTKDTFACRFYDRMANGSPCEKNLILSVVRIRLFDSLAKPIPKALYRLNIGQKTQEGNADGDGWAIVYVVEVPNQAVIEWGHQDDSKNQDQTISYEYKLALYLDYSQGDDQQEQAKRRLHNLGYPSDLSFDENIKTFQKDYGLPESGELDDKTQKKLWSVHDDCQPESKTSPAAE
jgi:outer membrane protein OmpA-like peptidoglycan-associated protein